MDKWIHRDEKEVEDEEDEEVVDEEDEEVEDEDEDEDEDEVEVEVEDDVKALKKCVENLKISDMEVKESVEEDEEVVDEEVVDEEDEKVVDEEDEEVVDEEDEEVVDEEDEEVVDEEDEKVVDEEEEEKLVKNSEFLRKQGIEYLYHFTDKRNLKSISQHGLLSVAEIENCKLEVIYSSSENSRQIDKRNKLDNFVRVSFTKDHPMMHVAKTERRIDDCVVLKIGLEAADQVGTLFSDRNAVCKNCKIEDKASHLHFETVKLPKQFNASQEEKTFYQAEVLIPSPICMKHIKGYNFKR